jgi:hypothetical protein
MQISEQTKKGFLYFGICLVIFALIFLSAFAVNFMTRANNNNPSKYGVYKIRLAGDGWELGERQSIVMDSIKELNRLGPTIMLVDSGENVAVYLDGQRQSINRTNCFAGIYQESPSPRIKLIPTCIRSNLEFQSTFMHEVGHALGMQHICRKTDDASDCSTIGYAPSFMNPALNYGTIFSSLRVMGETDEELSIPMVEVTSYDVREFQRVWNGRRY